MKNYAFLLAVLAACAQQRPVATMRRNTSIPFPVRLHVAYDDGTTQDFSLPVNIWARGNRFDAVLPVRGPVTGVRLWPDPSVPDWNPSNDTWGNPPPANPPGPGYAQVGWSFGLGEALR